jgi:hypothetical protein
MVSAGNRANRKWAKAVAVAGHLPSNDPARHALALDKAVCSSTGQYIQDVRSLSRYQYSAQIIANRCLGDNVSYGKMVEWHIEFSANKKKVVEPGPALNPAWPGRSQTRALPAVGPPHPRREANIGSRLQAAIRFKRQQAIGPPPVSLAVAARGSAQRSRRPSES